MQDLVAYMEELQSCLTERKYFHRALTDTRMEQNILEKVLEGSMEPTDLPLELLREITNGFSADRIIGEGGFGTVYKGIVGNRNVAVKRIRSSMTIEDKLFRRELNSLMQVNHQNIVRFLGLCSHTIETPMKNPESQGYIFAEIRERLLCFEYINNGTLDKKITDELRGLEWDKRYEIIKGICTGLHYLHMEKCILHMDLKPANILLDNNFLPKITDFGLSRPEENSQTISTNIFLTPGYCAPENLFGCGRMTVQSDIYNLGVIIIEIVTGNKGIPNNNDNILRRWMHRWNKSKETSLKYHEQVTKCIEIGSLCQKVDPYARPSISEIMRKFVELESMDNCNTLAHDSTAGQIKPPYLEDDMLGVEPLELQFTKSRNNINKQSILSCSVEMRNNTNSFIAFHIQKTSPLPYSIKPNKDIVEPQSKCIVEIILPAPNTQDHNNKRYTKEFIVRSLKVNEGLTVNDINEELFNTYITGQHVDEIYLSVISAEPCNKEVMESPTNQAKQYASFGATVQLLIKSSAVAPLLEHKKEVILELTGGDYSNDRLGLDLVAVVDISIMKGEKMDQLKTAMGFLVGKLSPMDRLSVIAYTTDANDILPLRKLMEASSQCELQYFISKLEAGRFGNMSEGLQAGLSVLASREVCDERVNAVMLVFFHYYGDLPWVDVGDVPVYTFYCGSTHHGVPKAPSQVSANSIGGTFTLVSEEDTAGLARAFSRCLAGLLTVTVQNLELTLAPLKGESKIVKVNAGRYPQKHEQNGREVRQACQLPDLVTIRFGNLCSKEVRKVAVELLLSTIHSERSPAILDVTYSHDRRSSAGTGRIKFVAPAETVTVWRSGVDFLEEEKPAGLPTTEDHFYKGISLSKAL